LGEEEGDSGEKGVESHVDPSWIFDRLGLGGG